MSASAPDWNREDWTDEAFEAPLDAGALVVDDPGAGPLALSLVAMGLVILAFAIPVLGSIPPLYIAGLALRRLANLPAPERRRVPLHLRMRVRRRAMSAAGFASLFAVLWLVYLF
ncbi:MAG: hypothetical protein EP330_23025 [Deltaproteobacteria bacterium]|nr:MAG: hypothetical protein EP330_23025 [Deltaproteobacteria bacterium]